jgi:hypothetical protein
MARAELRFLPARIPPASAPTVVVTTPEALRELVREAVTEALPSPEPAPALLDRRALAAALACCTDKIDQLRREGMPVVKLGDSPRFELQRCLEWLRARP